MSSGDRRAVLLAGVALLVLIAALALQPAVGLAGWVAMGALSVILGAGFRLEWGGGWRVGVGVLAAVILTAFLVSVVARALGNPEIGPGRFSGCAGRNRTAASG